MDIKRITKDPNPGFFLIFFFFCEMGWRGWGRGQGRARGGVGRGVGAIIFICDALYQANTHCFTFS